MTFDARNKQVALSRIKRLAVSGLPLEPFVLTLFQLVNDAVPYSAIKGFAAMPEQPTDWICNAPELYRTLPAAGRFFLDETVDLSRAGLRVPMNFKSVAALFPKRNVVPLEACVFPEFWRSEAFNLFMKPIDWWRNVVVLLREGNQLLGGLPIWRGANEKPFSKEDLCFLRACVPYLSHGLRTAQLIEERATLSAGDFLPSSLWDTGVVLIDSSGGIVAMDAPARLAFDQLPNLDRTGFPTSDSRAREILEYLRRLTLSAFRDPAVVWPAPVIAMFAHWSGATLKLRGAVAEAADGRQYVTVIVERGETAVLRRQRTMLRWGLSEREAEVLDLVSKGKTNSEIAVVLGASQLTVKKHLEHIIQKLGVETRTGAAAVALSSS